MESQGRSDTDTWDLATGVGATATMVAAARAVASSIDDRLISDVFAEPLVRAVGIDFFNRWVGGELNLTDNAARQVLQGFVDLMAVRTRYFDTFLLDATTAGVRQVVILASGLDSRGYRMVWPASTVVFEIDQPQVLEFKTTTLARLNAEPTTDLRVVPVDLRRDWPAALQRYGFVTDRPTAWIAEGLLPFLRPDTQDHLLDTITALSPAGSRLATEVFVPPTNQLMQPLIRQWREQGFSVEPANLVYDGERNNVADYLDDRGWRSTKTSMNQLLTENGLPSNENNKLFIDNYYYISIRSS